MNAPRRTQEDRREATRDALLTATIALLAEKGAAATTFQDVVERAGLSKGALTHHFDSKDALLEAALDRVGASLHQHLAAAWDPTLPALPRLRRAVSVALALADDRPSELRVLAVLSAEALHTARLASSLKPHLDALERCMADGISLTITEIGARTRVSPEAFARALVEAELGAALRSGEHAERPHELRNLWTTALLAAIDFNEE